MAVAAYTYDNLPQRDSMHYPRKDTSAPLGVGRTRTAETRTVVRQMLLTLPNLSADNGPMSTDKD